MSSYLKLSKRKFRDLIGFADNLGYTEVGVFITLQKSPSGLMIMRTFRSQWLSNWDGD